MNAHLLLPQEHSLKRENIRAGSESLAGSAIPCNVDVVWTETSRHEFDARSSFDGFHCLRDRQPVVAVEVRGKDIRNLANSAFGSVRIKSAQEEGLIFGIGVFSCGKVRLYMFCVLVCGLDVEPRFAFTLLVSQGE